MPARFVPPTTPYPKTIPTRDAYRTTIDPTQAWDWQNPPIDQDGNPLGPNGEKLPPLATGWRPNGTPDFGSTDILAPFFSESPSGLNSEGIKSWIKRAVSNIEVAYQKGYDEGFLLAEAQDAWDVVKQAPEPIQDATLVAGSAIVGGSNKFLSAATGGLVEEVPQLKRPKGEWGKYLNGALSAAMQMGEEALRGLFDLISLPAEATERNLGTTILTIEDVLKGKTIDQKTLTENWNASQMAYDAIFQDLMKINLTVMSGYFGTKFVLPYDTEDRITELVDSGVRPDLAEEIVYDENKFAMWPELVGQLVLDPLNLLDAPLKTLQGAKRTQAALRLISNQDEVADAVRALEKFAEQGRNVGNNAEAAKLFNAAFDAVRSDMLMRAGKLDELKTVIHPFVWSKSRYANLSKLTKTSRVGALASVAHDAINIIVGGTKGPDDALEMFVALKNLGSGDERLMRTGFATLMHFPNPQMAFSPAMQELAYFLGHFDTTGFLKTIKQGGDKGQLVNILAAKMDRAIEGMYPSISKMMEADKAVKAGKATDAEVAMSELLKKVPAWQKWVTKANDSVIAKGWRKIQSSLSYFQLGTPGFASRNLLNNDFHILVDEGIEALFGNADVKYAEIARLNGADIPIIGYGPQASFVQNIKGYTSTQPTTLGEAIKQAVTKFDVRVGSGVLETQGKKRVIAAAYRRQWDSMVVSLQRIIRDAGIPDAIVRKLPDYLLNNYGDVDKVVDAIKADTKAQILDIFADSSYVPFDLKTFFKDWNQWDEFRNTVLKAPTKAEALDALDKLFAKLRRVGENAFTEGAPVTDDFVRTLGDEGIAGPVSMQVFEQRKQANRNLVKRVGEVFDQLTAGLTRGETQKILSKNKVPIHGSWGDDVISAADELNNRVLDLYKRQSRAQGADLYALWNANIDIFKVPPPPNLTRDLFDDALWTNYRYIQNGRYNDAADLAAKGYIKSLQELGIKIPPESQKIIDEATENAARYRSAEVGRYGYLVTGSSELYGTRSTQISQIAQRYGLSTATEKGIFTDKMTLNVINKHASLPGGATYKSLEEVPLTVAEDAIKDWARTHGIDVTKIPERAATSSVEKIPYIHPDVSDSIIRSDPLEPTIGKLVNADPRVVEYQSIAKKYVEENFGRKQMFYDDVDISELEKILRRDVPMIRATSSRVAQEAATFTLLNYGEKTHLDLALAYLFPYHFWYGRTYYNWIQRLATDPHVLAAYAKYRDNMAAIHSGLPEFYKYNMNVNDLPGVNVDNPLMFNLEGTLWPLNGITGVDFNDPYKRVNWWTTMLDYSGRFGPTVFSPIQIVTGIALYEKGIEEGDAKLQEAGRRWMGRLFPQTGMIKNVSTLIERKTGMDVPSLFRYNEWDPLVGLQGGLDAYEERRVSRALAAMILEAQEGRSPYTVEQIYDAGYSRTGEIWEEAVSRGTAERAWPSLSSFFFGVGFKGRTEADLQNEAFFSEYGRLMNMRPNISTEEWRNAMTELQHKYPFMDTLLIANRRGTDRDSGYAYTVLSRIPPSRMDDYAKLVSLDPEMINRFYDDKGAIDKWSESDRAKFMAAIMDLAATLEIPSDATRQEWTDAKNAYTKLTEEGKKMFGEGIWDEVNEYYTLKIADRDAANDYLDSHPEVSAAMDWKAERIFSSPLLSAYYGSIGTLEGYLKSQMYTEIEGTLGQDFFDVLDEYNRLKTYGTNDEVKAFYKIHKDKIKTYHQILDTWQVAIDKAIVNFTVHVPDVDSKVRQDFDPLTASAGAQDLAAGLQQPYVRSMTEWQTILTPELLRLVVEHFTAGEVLEYEIQQKLDRIAYDLGYENGDALVQAVGVSLYSP